MDLSKRSCSDVQNLGVIFLAAGYGTRLQRDMKSDPQFHSLTSTPKPLLPLGGRVILDHWLENLTSFPAIASIVVITNEAHHQLYKQWSHDVNKSNLAVHQFPIHIVSDGSTKNNNRLGAVTCINLAITELRKSNADKAIIIAGDTILPDIELHTFVSQFVDSEYNAATFAYPLPDIKDHVRRGMFKYEEKDDGIKTALALVEKPQTLSQVPSNLSSAPVYMLKKKVWDTVSDFLKHTQHLPLEKRDAPGFWLGWMIPREPCMLFTVEKRIDIGGLQHYKDALWDMTIPHQNTPKDKRRLCNRVTNEPAVGRAFPRIGFLGNPSDGYGGKVIAISVASEGYAEVVAVSSDKFSVKHNPDHELDNEFNDLRDFLSHIEGRGIYYGARTLVVAACIVFSRTYLETKTQQNTNDVSNQIKGLPSMTSSILQNCSLTYSTTIPARIGLSGSSALIIATLRALARFYNTSLEEINPDIELWPNLVQSAESSLMGISCGLMDRVVQIMQGCVVMDFTNNENGKWEYLPESSLPEMWVAYYEGEKGGECSGKVHGKLKERFLQGDKQVSTVVKELCQVVDTGRDLLEQGIASKSDQLPDLINRNFELRVALVGADRVGESNLKLVSLTREAGFASKMTGSGGCALCISTKLRKLKESEIQQATTFLKKHGIVLRKVLVQKRRFWQV